MAYLERGEDEHVTFEPGMDEVTCVECRKVVHEDDATHLFDGRMVCNWCRPDVDDQFGCDGCGDDFEHKGIPTGCPTCFSANVAHAYTDTHKLIEQKLVERIDLMNSEPLQTEQVLRQMREKFFPLSVPGRLLPGNNSQEASAAAANRPAAA